MNKSEMEINDDDDDGGGDDDEVKYQMVKEYQNINVYVQGESLRCGGEEEELDFGRYDYTCECSFDLSFNYLNCYNEDQN
ncbi:MAG: hypothetical protein EZS28_013719 [Streblomastix strix]|uniref:Uncharacterized protein n=1 Tax=Streblomastix strix TaxID=222440 RepID=A0A5J4W7V8_9EUKA|nr:MAG: hypothetical protein EZS28_013719 [Streblomastix strix]